MVFLCSILVGFVTKADLKLTVGLDRSFTSCDELCDLHTQICVWNQLYACWLSESEHFLEIKGVSRGVVVPTLSCSGGVLFPWAVEILIAKRR